jgi:hypothetical protein
MLVMNNPRASRPQGRWGGSTGAGMASGDASDQGHGSESMHERVRRKEAERRAEDGARRAAEKAALEVDHAKLVRAYNAFERDRHAAVDNDVPREEQFGVSFECALTREQHLAVFYFGREVARVMVRVPEGDFRVEERTGERRLEAVPVDDLDRLKDVVADMLAAHRRASQRRHPHDPASKQKPYQDW